MLNFHPDNNHWSKAGCLFVFCQRKIASGWTPLYLWCVCHIDFISVWLSKQISLGVSCPTLDRSCYLLFGHVRKSASVDLSTRPPRALTFLLTWSCDLEILNIPLKCTSLRHIRISAASSHTVSSRTQLSAQEQVRGNWGNKVNSSFFGRRGEKDDRQLQLLCFYWRIPEVHQQETQSMKKAQNSGTGESRKSILWNITCTKLKK